MSYSGKYLTYWLECFYDSIWFVFGITEKKSPVAASATGSSSWRESLLCQLYRKWQERPTIKTALLRYITELSIIDRGIIVVIWVRNL